MAERAHSGSRPLVEPLYWRVPSLLALRHPSSFWFGSDLLVAPIVIPRIPEIGMAAATTLLPPGVWFDIMTGLGYDGGREVALHRDLSGYPVLAPAGTILPLAGEDDLGVGIPEALELLVCAGADGEFTLYEDDDAASPKAVRTRFTLEGGRLVIHPAQVDEGAEGVSPLVRRYVVRVVGAAAPVGDVDPATGIARLDVGEVVAAEGRTVDLGDLSSPAPDVTGRVLALVDRLEMPFNDKDAIALILTTQPTVAGRLRGLLALDIPRPVLDAVAEVVAARV